MAKQIYNEKITRETDWGGDASTGGAPVSGARVQEYIKGEITALEQAIGNVPVVEVDDSLDAESTNAVSNAAVASELNRLNSGNVTGIDYEIDKDSNTVRLMLTNRQGQTLDDCEIPMLGGGGGESDATRLVLTTRVSKSTVKAGEAVQLAFDYDVVNSDGDSTDIKADIEVRVMCGATELYSRLRALASAGTYTDDLGPHLTPGTCDIYVKATWTGADGQPRSKQRYLAVKVVALSLTSDFPLTAMLQSGGYGPSDTAEIPYRVSGSGTKEVTLYIDGEQHSSHTVTATNPGTLRFLVPMASLGAGMHSAQIVATMDAGGRTLRSNSIYMTLLKQGAAKAVAAVVSNPDGEIVTGGSRLGPVVPVTAFEPLEITYGVYDSSAETAPATIREDGAAVSSLALPRTAQTYQTRYTTPGSHTIEIRCGEASLTIGVEVAAGDVSISETAYGRVCRLSARGRSNSEAAATRGVWSDGDTDTTFEGVDWRSSGWIDNALHLMGGAKATVNFLPFAEDGAATGVKAEGRTIELTLRISRINDYTRPIVSCMEGGRGFRIQGDEIAYLTGETTDYIDEEGQEQTREVKLSTNYVEGALMKVAFVVEKLSDRPVMHLYVDGNRCGADKYSTEASFLQAQPVGITFDSAAADIDLVCVRGYKRGLSDDEELDNFIADQTDTARMLELHNENDVLDQEGNVSMQELLSRGKGVLLIVRPGLLDDVYATNNKKTDFTASVRYYPPAGLGVPGFTVDDCYIRIQGTSSTKYPSKNLRLYLQKGPGGTKPALLVDGEPATKYGLRPGAVAMNIFCAKTDYSDSSMSLNTGGARLFTDVLKELELLTPPQRWQKEHGGVISVRASIDGVPVDVFAAESDDSTPVYYGQYNLNNEKSKSGPLFGMEGVEGYTPACPIALESLNNSQQLCLFQAPGDLDALLSETFDKAFEFNYPEDTFWSAASISDSSKESLASDAQRAAVRGLLSFIKACVPSGADPDDISTFVSAKFAAEASQHFDVDYLLTYYLWTEFFVSVDQRAKNILWRTWDGQIWYPTYYDGDTQRGKRNDSFMAYGPDTERDTWDVTASKYAFEGHDSWLWCLCLANFHPRMVTCAANLRQKLDADRALTMLVKEQSGNWSDRVFNKSGELKYITPAVQTMYGRTWPFIYALQGADRQHSEWFIRQRWALMDAKYGIGDYTSDNIDCYINRAATDAPTVIKVTGNRTYAFGYGTNNAANLGTTGLVAAGVEAALGITGAFAINDPMRIYGASRMSRLDMSGAAGALKNAFDISKCSALEELDMHVPAGGEASTGWYLAGAGMCPLLRRVDLRGQAQASTESGSKTLNFRANTRLESLDARGTEVTAVSLAPGAVTETLRLPGTLTALRLESLARLTGDGAADGEDFSVESLAGVASLTVTGCPGVDTLALVTRWLDEKTTPDSGCSLELDGVDWTCGGALIAAICALNTVDMTGTVDVGAITIEQRDAIVAKLGQGCFSPGAPLHVVSSGTVVLTADDNAPTMALLYASGLCAHEDYITAEEAAAATDADFKKTYWNQDSTYRYTVTDLDVLRHFTGLTQTLSLFVSMWERLERLTVPENVTALGDAICRIDKQLKHITFLPMESPTRGSKAFEWAGQDVPASEKVVEIPRGATGYEWLATHSELKTFTVVYID